MDVKLGESRLGSPCLPSLPHARLNGRSSFANCVCLQVAAHPTGQRERESSAYHNALYWIISGSWCSLVLNGTGFVSQILCLICLPWRRTAVDGSLNSCDRLSSNQQQHYSMSWWNIIQLARVCKFMWQTMAKNPNMTFSMYTCKLYVPSFQLYYSHSQQAKLSWPTGLCYVLTVVKLVWWRLGSLIRLSANVLHRDVRSEA